MRTGRSIAFNALVVFLEIRILCAGGSAPGGYDGSIKD